jgi:flavin reductase (DIM6/NTAB) family NADH-FMN oxidoreductase RutF
MSPPEIKTSPHAPEDLVIDQTKMRQTLAHFGTGVVIICASDDRNEPAGMAMNSFSSVSMDPPLISFCVDHGSTTWPKIAAANAFSVNILSETQASLGRKFSKRGINRFANVEWQPGKISGAPLLLDSTAWLECEIYEEVPAGDHQLILARIKHLEINETDLPPLMFFKSKFFGLHKHPLS